MQRPTLEEFATLIEVVERGGVTAAAARLRLAKSVVSKRMATLERRLGSSLLQRVGRSLTPTDTGMRTYEQAKLLLAEVDTLVDEVAAQQGLLRGPLRISGPQSFGVRYLNLVVADFMGLHPKVEIHLDLDDQHVDLGGQGYDVAIRIGRLKDSAYRSRRIATSRNGIYCSPSYARAAAPPVTLEALGEHACLGYANVAAGRAWRFEPDGGGEPRLLTPPPRFLSNSGEAMLAAATSGLGLAALPAFLAQAAVRAGLLVEWHVPGWTIAADTIHAVYPETIALPLRTREFINHVASRFTAPLPWDDA